MVLECSGYFSQRRISFPKIGHSFVKCILQGIDFLGFHKKSKIGKQQKKFRKRHITTKNRQKLLIYVVHNQSRYESNILPSTKVSSRSSAKIVRIVWASLSSHSRDFSLRINSFNFMKLSIVHRALQW